MSNDQIKIGFENGLHPIKNDARDFSLAGVFDQIRVEEIPAIDFIVAKPLRIKDQGDTDYCSAYAVIEASEDQEEIELLPEYQFFKTKYLMGDYESWGADLRTACKVAVRYGSLPVAGFEHLMNLPRSIVVNPHSWMKSLDTIAKRYSKETYFKIDGRYDLFDNIRCALWQHRAEKRSIVALGAEYITEWVPA
jgi:hypothetical protein